MHKTLTDRISFHAHSTQSAHQHHRHQTEWKVEEEEEKEKNNIKINEIDCKHMRILALMKCYKTVVKRTPNSQFRIVGCRRRAHSDQAYKKRETNDKYELYVK